MITRCDPSPQSILTLNAVCEFNEALHILLILKQWILTKFEWLLMFYIENKNFRLCFTFKLSGLKNNIVMNTNKHSHVDNNSKTKKYTLLNN